MADPTPAMPLAAGRLRSSVHVEDDLRAQIAQGVLAPGARLASRRDLARQYGVALGTVERALSGLLAEGVLRADGGRGTFVARRAADAPAGKAGAGVVYAAGGRGGGGAAAPAAERATVGIIASLYLMDQDHLELNNFWVRLLVHTLEYALSRDGAATRFFNRVQGGGRPLLSLEETITSAVEQGVDAIAIAGIGFYPDAVDRALAVLDGRPDMPLVCITGGEMRRPVPNVCLDNQSGGYQAAQHLIQGGARDLLFFAPFWAQWVEERWAGIRAAAEHAGLPPEAVRVYPADRGAWVQEEDPAVLGYLAGRRAVAEPDVLRPGAPPLGVIGVNDGAAFGLLRAAEEAGRRPGPDFALISFDDHPDARTVGLTTLRPPVEAMGQEAARLLLSALGGARENGQVRLPWNLLPRESTRRTTDPVRAAAAVGQR